MSAPSRTALVASDWDALHEVAQGQADYFTTRQGAAAGYLPPAPSASAGRLTVQEKGGVSGRSAPGCGSFARPSALCPANLPPLLPPPRRPGTSTGP